MELMEGESAVFAFKALEINNCPPGVLQKILNIE